MATDDTSTTLPPSSTIAMVVSSTSRAEISTARWA